MSITNSTNRTSTPQRAPDASPTAPAKPAKDASAATSTSAPSTGATTQSKAPTASTEVKSDQYVKAQSQASSSTSLGPSTAKPSRAADLGKLVKPAESFLLKISETRGPQVAAELRQMDRSIDARAAEGSAALGPAGGGVSNAIAQTTDRVLQRVAEGKIAPDEAKQAMGQLDVLADALKMVKDGNLPNLQRVGANLLDAKSQALNFDVKKGNDTFTVQMYTNPERAFGEARVGFAVVKKNGENIPWTEQFGLRVDHQKVDNEVAVDVSSPLLDKKIHGAMCDGNGVPLRNGTVPDHHFKTGLPGALNDPAAFTKFVEDFQAKSVTPAESKLPPSGIAYQTDNKVSLDAITKFHGADAAKKLGEMNSSIDAMARQGSQALGPAAEGVARAVDQTTDRILGRVAQGTLSVDEATRAMDECKLIGSALQAIKGGKLDGLTKGGTNLSDPTLQGYNFKMQVGSDSFGVKVTTRAEAGAGEARLGVFITEKNGQKLSPNDQVSMRVDLQKFDGKVAVDMDSTLLDMRVHGQMDSSKTDGRAGIPDHHFKDGIPDNLSDPKNFSKMVTDFRTSYMKTPVPTS